MAIDLSASIPTADDSLPLSPVLGDPLAGHGVSERVFSMQDPPPTADALLMEPLPDSPLERGALSAFEERERFLISDFSSGLNSNTKPMESRFSRTEDRDPLFVNFSGLQEPGQMLSLARSQLGFSTRVSALVGLPFVSLRPASVPLGVPSDWEAAFFVLCANNAVATGKLCVFASSLSEMGLGHPASLRALSACAQRSQWSPRILLRRDDDSVSKGALSEWIARNPGLAQFRVLPRHSPIGQGDGPEHRRNFYLGAGPLLARRFDFEQPFGTLESDLAQSNSLLSVFDSIWHTGTPLFGPQPLMI